MTSLAHKDVDEDLQKHLECVLCLEEFNEPKRLTCNHLFCKECLQQITTFSQDGSAVITCPLKCTALTPLTPTQTVNDLCSDIYIQGILDNLAGKSGGECFSIGGCVEKGDEKWGNGRCNRKVTGYCRMCNHVLCSLCTALHGCSNKDNNNCCGSGNESISRSNSSKDCNAEDNNTISGSENTSSSEIIIYENTKNHEDNISSDSENSSSHNNKNNTSNNNNNNNNSNNSNNNNNSSNNSTKNSDNCCIVPVTFDKRKQKVLAVCEEHSVSAHFVCFERGCDSKFICHYCRARAHQDHYSETVQDKSVKLRTALQFEEEKMRERYRQLWITLRECNPQIMDPSDAEHSSDHSQNQESYLQENLPQASCKEINAMEHLEKCNQNFSSSRRNQLPDQEVYSRAEFETLINKRIVTSFIDFVQYVSKERERLLKEYDELVVSNYKQMNYHLTDVHAFFERMRNSPDLDVVLHEKQILKVVSGLAMASDEVPRPSLSVGLTGVTDFRSLGEMKVQIRTGISGIMEDLDNEPASNDAEENYDVTQLWADLEGIVGRYPLQEKLQRQPSIPVLQTATPPQPTLTQPPLSPQPQQPLSPQQLPPTTLPPTPTQQEQPPSPNPGKPQPQRPPPPQHKLKRTPSRPPPPPLKEPPPPPLKEEQQQSKMKSPPTTPQPPSRPPPPSQRQQQDQQQQEQQANHIEAENVSSEQCVSEYDDVLCSGSQDVSKCSSLDEIDTKSMPLFPDEQPASCTSATATPSDAPSIISLKSHLGAYVRVGPSGRLIADSQHVRLWEQFIVEHIKDHTIALKSVNDKYLGVTESRALVADRATLGMWEKFTVETCGDGTIAVRAHDGKYLCAENDGLMVIQSESVGKWEKFVLEDIFPVEGSPLETIMGSAKEKCAAEWRLDFQTMSKILLKSPHGLFVHVRVTGVLAADKTEEIGEVYENVGELFEVECMEDKKLALKSSITGKYVGVTQTRNLVANREKVRSWEKFEVTEQEDGTVVFKICDGTYICAEKDGNIIAGGKRVGKSEKFTVEVCSTVNNRQ